MRGLAALSEPSDVRVLLTRTDRYRVYLSVQRVGPDFPEATILVDAQTGRITLGPERAEADRSFTEEQNGRRGDPDSGGDR